MSGITSSTGINIYEQFNKGLDAVNERGKQLSEKMDKLFSQDEISQADMLMIQFEMGQYNAMLESVSSLTKSMTDMLKTLAQRQG